MNEYVIYMLFLKYFKKVLETLIFINTFIITFSHVNNFLKLVFNFKLNTRSY